MKKLKLSKHKREVWVEQLNNTLIGSIVAYVATVALGPYILGHGVTHETSLLWTLIMTIISVLRGYIIRLYYSRKRYIKELRKELRDVKRSHKHR
jgi:archaellum biogenesis protein FlaJ (TadC family)